jgi:leader peptidase (prepilin peptidase)/N-methyltransferase
MLLGLALVALLVPAALIDLERRVIPNALMAIGAAAGLVLVLAVDAGNVAGHLAAAAGAGGFFLAAALACPEGMGMGDVKLAAVLGLYLDGSVVLALLVALLAGTAAGAVIVARRGVRAGRRATIPFGPFLALGGVVAVVASIFG